MVMVYAPRHLMAGTELFANHITPWITRARNFANQANPGNVGLGVLFGGAPDNATALVEDWFGILDANQQATLVANLALMRTVLLHPQASVRIIDAPMIHGDRDYYAQVRGRYNARMPRLSVEVADEWRAANLDTKVNSLFHELSHRILGTLDVGPTEGYPEDMYGLDNAQHLAANAPDDALRNAENYGYFIALCNGYVNQAP